MSVTRVISQEVDSIISVKYSPFFTDYLKKEEYVYPLTDVKTGLVKTEFKRLNAHWRRIFRIGNELYLHFSSTGKLYKKIAITDSTLLFKRVDNSDNYNYNCISTIITDRNSIFDFAGYGFWKSNGTLRQFNTIDGEWDSYPIDREVCPPLYAFGAWYDPSAHEIIVPYQEVLNEGLIKSVRGGELNFTSNALNIDSHSWRELGEMTPFAKKIFIKDASTINTVSGILFIYYDRVYLADLRNNQINVLSNSEKAQSLVRIPESSMYYFSKNKVYTLNVTNYKYDSIEVDLSKFVPLKEKIWETKVNYTPYVAGSSILFLLGFTFLLYKRRTKKRNERLSQVAELVNPFTETEIGLLELLLKNSKKEKTVNITDINYVLGIKDKNQGMQKKVRSDVIGSINEKYSIFTKQKESLVQSVRSDTDKRYFEYFINKDAIASLEKLLELD